MNVHPEIRRIMPSARLAARETAAQTHIPITRFLDNGMLVTRNGDLMTVLAIDGFTHETADAAEISSAHDAIARFAATFEDNHTAIYTHTLRHRIDLAGSIAPVPGAGFEAQLDRHYRAQLGKKQAYRVRHYITILRHPVRVSARTLDAALRWLRRNTTDPEQAAQRLRNIEALHSATGLAMEILAPFGPRRLTGSEDDRSETLTFLSMLQSGIWMPCPAAWANLGETIPLGRITFRQGGMIETRSPGGDNDRMSAVFALHTYPSYTSSTMLNDLLSEPLEFIATQCFAPLDRVSGGGRVRDARKGMKDAGDEAVSLSDALTKAADAVASREMSIGRHHYTVAVTADSRVAFENAAARMNAILSGAGMRVRREDIGAELAWWAQMPGNFAYQARSRKRFISNLNFADFTAFHKWPVGARRKLRWGGPVTAFRTAGGTPYWFSFHREGDSGENGPGTTAVFGAPGEGKTLLVNFLLAACARLPEPPDIIAFDKDRGSESFIRAIGGSYLVLRPGLDLGFNPFQMATDPEGVEWLEGFIARLARLDDITPEQERRIAAAAKRNAAAEPSLRNFTDFAALFRSVDDADTRRRVQDALAKWHGSGDRAWLFDNKEDSFSLDRRVIAFDMTALLEADEIRPALLDYLFFRIQRKLQTGRPTIIVLDEAWRLLDDARFAGRIRDWIKTIRKLNGIVIFMTQEASDAAKSSISDTLVQSTENRIFFPNPKADALTYCEKFRLTSKEFETIRTMPPRSRGILIQNSVDSLTVSTRLTVPAPFLKVLSGTAQSIGEMDRLRAEYGDEGWLDAFMSPQKEPA